MSTVGGKGPESEVVLAIDVGGSKFIVGYVNSAGEVLYQQRYEWENEIRSPDLVVEQISKRIEELRLRHFDVAARVQAAGMTLPGFVDSLTGLWVESDFMGAYGYPIAERMSERIGLSVYVDNDCKACALSERMFGAGRQDDDFLYITVSNGVGGSMYFDGKPYDGAFGHAGEIGLFVVEPGGRPSETDCAGVLEAYASGRGLHQTYVEYGGSELDGQGIKMGGAYISQRAEAGESAALKTFDDEGRYLGRVLATAIALVDPGRIIVGGGLSLVFNRWATSLFRYLERNGIEVDKNFDIPIEPTKLGYQGAFLGAAALAFRGMRGRSLVHDLRSETQDSLIVRVGESVEAELRLRGNCYVGAHGRAGRLGDVVIDNQNGSTLSDHLSAKRLLQEWESLSGDSKSGKCVGDLIGSARKGDQAALKVLSNAGYLLGRAIAFGCILLDPRTVHIEGELTKGKAFIEPALLDALHTETYYRGALPFDVEFSKG